MYSYLSRKESKFFSFSFFLSHFIRGSRRVWRSLGDRVVHSVNSGTRNLWGRGYLRLEYKCVALSALSEVVGM
jgi:hypothetical protein